MENNLSIVKDKFKEYHVIEEYIRPVKIEKDQALFIVPEIINTSEIKLEFEKFIYVLNWIFQVLMEQ